MFSRAISNFAAPSTQSPMQMEKDEAIRLARRCIRDRAGLTAEECETVARQLLRALSLTQ